MDPQSSSAGEAGGMMRLAPDFVPPGTSSRASSGGSPSDGPSGGEMPRGAMDEGDTSAGDASTGDMPRGHMADAPGDRGGSGPVNRIGHLMDQVMPGATPGGTMPGGAMSGGDMPAGDMPAGDMPGGGAAAGGASSGAQGEMPAGRMDAGPSAGGDALGTQAGGGSMPAGAMNGGPAEQSGTMPGAAPATPAADGTGREMTLRGEWRLTLSHVEFGPRTVGAQVHQVHDAHAFFHSLLPRPEGDSWQPRTGNRTTPGARSRSSTSRPRATSCARPPG